MELTLTASYHKELIQAALIANVCSNVNRSKSRTYLVSFIACHHIVRISPRDHRGYFLLVHTSGFLSIS